MGNFDKEASVRAAEAAWASSRELRHEFGDDKEAFIAYRCAVDAGRVKERPTASAGAGAATSAAQPAMDDQQVRAQAEREWNESAAIRAEFGHNQARYVAWRSAQARGAIRIQGRKMSGAAPGKR